MNDGKAQFKKLTVLESIKDGNNWYWLCKCACGNIVLLTEQEILNKDCGSACLSSRGEVCAADIFNELNVKYQVQKKFPDFDLKFDFYLPDYNIIIECDGAQHFRSVNNDWNSKCKLQETRQRDEQKAEYCKKKGITLLQIPFWDFQTLNVESLRKVIKNAGSD